jgi:hypothetical protein
MKRVLIPGACAALLALPAGASARVKELGRTEASVTVSCPTNCQAIARVTGYMGRSANLRNPFRIPRDGKIVAWTIKLGRPDATQVEAFTRDYGGPPQARITVVRPGKRNRNGFPHRLLAQSPLQQLDTFFGSTPSFALDRPIEVERGNIVAVTVPTWAPSLAVGLGRDNWWRSSRRRRTCMDVTQRAATQAIGGLRHYGCTYFTARLLYTVTYVPDPRPTSPT